MSKNKISFAESIAYMTANPGKEIRSAEGDLFRFESGYYWFFDSGEKSWEQVDFFDCKDIGGQWTIPEEKEELPEVEVVAYIRGSGQMSFVKKGSKGDQLMENLYSYTKCKIKFNQGEE